MDHMLNLGFICQPWKTQPLSQVQVFCGMVWDTRETATLRISQEKVSRAKATIRHLKLLNEQQQLSRLTGAVGGGLLQSLVDATPSRQGQTHLRRLYDDIYLTTTKYGKALYYTKFQMNELTLLDLD